MNTRRALCLALILTIAVGLSFWQVRSHDFSNFDDPLHVVNNAYIQPPSPAKFWFFWRVPFDPTPVPGVPTEGGALAAPYRQIYAPLAFTTWGLATYLARKNVPPEQLIGPNAVEPLDASIYHSLNLTLHLLNTLMVFALLRRLLRNDWGAAAGALIFGLHPLQADPVSWITGMNNILSGAFALGALLAYMAFIQRQKGGWGLYALATLAFAASMLSKPSSAPLPFIALLLAWADGRWTWRRCSEMIPWVLIAAFCAWQTKSMQSEDLKSVYFAWYLRPFLVSDALAFYLAKTFWPFTLGPDYGRKPHIVLENWWGYTTWLLPAGVGVLLALGWRNPQRRPLFRWLWAAYGIFVVTLVPTSGIIPYYYHLISTVADRYMYFALVGVGLAVGAGVAYFLEHAPTPNALRIRVSVTAAGLAVLGLFLGWRSYLQADLWSTDRDIWSHVLTFNPRSGSAYFMVSGAELKAGNIPRAWSLIQQGLKYDPENWKLLSAAATAARQMGNRQEAIRYYRASLRVFPTNVDAHYKLGVTLADEGRYKEAVVEYGEGLKVRPDHADLLGHFGVAAGKLGDPVLGEYYLRKALQAGFDPGTGHYFLGVTLAQQNKIEEAMDEWILSANLAPNYYETHYNMGLAYEKRGQLDEAVAAFNRTIRLKPQYAPAYFDLGLVLERQKKLAEAKASLETAVELQPDTKAYRIVLARVRRALSAQPGAARH